MYSVSAYGAMIADRVRMDAYHAALRGAIDADSVVLDVGTGTGIFALLACQFGARHVYAIDTEDVIDLARDIAYANGYGEQITFFQADSRRVSLPQPVDVLVSDIRGTLPLLGDNIATLIDARDRLLAPHGCIIPRRDTLWVSVVEAVHSYQKSIEPWDQHGLDMATARNMSLNSWHEVVPGPKHHLTSPVCWAEIDYAAVQGPDVSATVTRPAERAGTGHGLLLWFDTELFPGVAFSNASLGVEGRARVYGQVFLPWLEPVALEPGDEVRLTLAATLTHGGYVWRWNSAVTREGVRRAEFNQSDFLGQTLSRASLRRKALDFTPTLSEAGRIRLAILARIDGHSSLQDIARALRAEFPASFSSDSAAAAAVAAVSVKYGV